MRCKGVLLVLGVLAGCGDEDEGLGGTGGPFFDHPMFFNRDVSDESAASNSETIMSTLRADGGWGNGDRMQIDFGFDVLRADSSTPMRTFTPTDDFYTPDCDETQIPVPDAGNVEGESGYACTQDGDCHLLVFDDSAGKLYEMWRANIASSFEGGCLAVWDSHFAYDDALRGEQCTSADAAGLPIAPLIFTADEVAAGEISHAIRFILPNDRVQQRYVHPATHGTFTSGGESSAPYGVHLRLKSSFDLAALPSEGARVVARAMQKYGMYHADGGNITLTAATDRYTAAKWDGLLDSHDLASLRVEDFEVIDHGPSINLTLNCSR